MANKTIMQERVMAVLKFLKEREGKKFTPPKLANEMKNEKVLEIGSRQVRLVFENLEKMGLISDGSKNINIAVIKKEKRKGRGYTYQWKLPEDEDVIRHKLRTFFDKFLGYIVPKQESLIESVAAELGYSHKDPKFRKWYIRCEPKTLSLYTSDHILYVFKKPSTKRSINLIDEAIKRANSEEYIEELSKLKNYLRQNSVENYLKRIESIKEEAIRKDKTQIKDLIANEEIRTRFSKIAKKKEREA